MKITTIIENNLGENKELESEHGLCYFVEVDNLKILFDTGQSSKALCNFKKLGFNTKELDYILLSHGHYDHAGGLSYFLNDGFNGKIIVGNNFFERSNKWHTIKNKSKYIGINFCYEDIINKGIEVIEVKDSLKIGEKLYLLSNLSEEKEKNNYNEKNSLVRVFNNKYVLDNFADELVLIVNEEKVSLITGCSHTGILNIVNKSEKFLNKNIDNLMGGIHLSNKSYDESLKVAESLKKFNIRNFSFCHCSGKEISLALNSLGYKVIEGVTGTVYFY